ncbi:hydroxylamine reductase [Clostridium beijerinckii]|uniref:Hydroxylamine reductase n=3 Tax=Clostridium beijerinckii TaxID=1520 RepID=A0AAE2RVA4_CLOBE|nr:hydroxylamine reductase [Clostridium beijerinckii]ABR35153.1 hybrid cluster protein [Clostridium beijerinckii NCIMB 8052]AIU00611.1 hydroxylamine reductase [Clostridium beijerinckii ATCC 35702]MBF7810213.1 hydroxylamine reductase [Clostridium beijerinckii]NOW90855.1 hydroxylamine reductase [Clostridium beijerinckii]NRT23456.1 hydroxylamine reductase [Clostridium beijerinckii]
MVEKMFCYQCEQTAGGKGCTKIGVCGKTPEIAAMQDLLIYQLKGISVYAKELLNRNEKVDTSVASFVEDSLFMTLTNVNFDPKSHLNQLKKSQEIKESLREKVKSENITSPEALYNLSDSKESILEDAEKAGIMYDENLDPDIRSLRETIKYGLKGIAAYSHQARFIKYTSDEVNDFYFKALAALADDSLNLEDLIKLAMETGTMSVNIMEVLDTANNTTYSSPSPTKVNVNIKKGPFIVVSGHDLRDLEMLLEQTEGKGINIYTHGEMLPSHGYPELNKYPHLVGNFGSAWQNQQKEFDNIPGCILMTTNCLMRPKDSYIDRIFSTSVVGFDGIKHIEKDENGYKDFSEIINKALELGGFTEDEEVKEILVGFGHKATLSHAETIINAVKDGKVKHFFLIGGCDGAKPGRNYYTEFAEKIPKDCIILTLACGKYRFNKLQFGEVAGLPRLLDVGQCNDAYSAVRIALALADAFNCTVNDLPLSIVLSWYEQKAVCDLLALLSLGVKGMYIGPSLPAFLTPNVLNFLVDNFDLKPIRTPDEDLKQILG